jgi:hypothetical protein
MHNNLIYTFVYDIVIVRWRTVTSLLLRGTKQSRIMQYPLYKTVMHNSRLPRFARNDKLLISKFILL